MRAEWALLALRILRAHAPALKDAAALAGHLKLLAPEGNRLAFGRILSLGDLPTLPQARGCGHAGAPLRWLDAEALRLDCVALHLRQRGGESRFAAHWQDLTHDLNLTCHHFDKRLT